MNKKDLKPEQLYEAVKLMLEMDHPHLHLGQQKLYTLFSIAFQYLLFLSTKEPGNYLVRVQDSKLIEKLIRKSKDVSTRNFMQKLSLPRKLKFQNSMFYLDFFNIGSWGMINDLPKDKFRAALVVKDTVDRPLDQSTEATDEEEEEAAKFIASLPADYYISTLIDFMPKTINIALGEPVEGAKEVKFPFIKEERDLVKGVRVSQDIKFDDID